MDTIYREARTYDIKVLEWNVLESPVFRFQSRGFRLAFQLLLIENEERTRFLDRTSCKACCTYKYDVQLKCIEMPAGWSVRSVKIDGLNNTIGGFASDIDEFPLDESSGNLCLGSNGFEFIHFNCKVDASLPTALDVSFEVTTSEGYIVAYTEPWTFASPWLELSDDARLRVFFWSETKHCDRKNSIRLQIEPAELMENILISVRGFDGTPNRYVTADRFDENQIAGFPFAPNGEIISIFAGVLLKDEPAVFLADPDKPLQVMFESAISEQAENSDCTLRIAGCDFYCHKAVLALYAYFQAKFNVDKADKPLIELTFDISVATVTELVRYLYLKEIENLDEHAEDLIGVSNELMLEELKQRCSDVLKHKLCVESVLSYFVMADRMQCASLKNGARDFLLRNIAEVKGHDEEKWKKFLKNNLELVTELLTLTG